MQLEVRVDIVGHVDATGRLLIELREATKPIHFLIIAVGAAILNVVTG
jgi:hypothetical protein